MNGLAGIDLGDYWSRPPGIPVREFPGIADPQNSRGEFSGISEILAGIKGIYGSFVFFPIFIVDYDILVFNLTHCIMSLYVHDAQ